MSGTVTGGVQTTNNVVGTGGVNLPGYTDQTSTAAVYVTASGITAAVRGRRVAYTVSGQRGAAIAYNSGNRVFPGMKWDYKGNSGVKYNYNLWYKFQVSGSFQTSVVLLNPLYPAGVTLQLAGAAVVGDTFISTHDRSFCRSDMHEITEHDESFAGK